MRTPSRGLQGFLQAIVENPANEDLYLILADWLEEKDDPRRAELLRLHRRLLATCCEPDQHPERENWQTRIVALLADGVKPCVSQRAVRLSAGVEVMFSFIPPGTFLMGSPPNEEERSDDEQQHRVTLTKGFFLGVHQVTQAQWQAVMGSNPSHFRDGNRPVKGVTWQDCQEFCKKLSERDGKKYRLPTEAEWEYACRAGTTTPFSFGETISTDQVNYNGNYTYGKARKGQFRQQTTPVGSFPPNAWGLYDMHGNVWECCSDWYEPYQPGDVKDPQGAQNGDTRVQRGGSWAFGPEECLSASRSRIMPSIRYKDVVGCRVVLCLD